MIPKEFLITDPSKLVKGQKLWSAQFGEVEFDYISIVHTILVKTPVGLYGYNIDGKKHKDEIIPSLLLNSPFESNERVILVNKRGQWLERELIKLEGEYAVFWEYKKAYAVDFRNRSNVSKTKRR
jgi:hypothetical protein